MFKVLFLSKIYPACHFDVNGIKPGSNSIMTDKHTTEHSYNNMAKTINIRDRNAIFDFTGKFSYK